MSYSIGAYGFIRWQGSRPQYVRQHVREFRKPGQNGIAAQLQGVNGDPFQVQLSAAFTNESNARVAEVGYRTLIGTTQILIYEGTNYATTYSHQYLVHDVQPVSAKSHPRLIGPTYDYPNGWLLVSDWTLIPIATA